MNITPPPDPYLPFPARITEIVVENEQIKTLVLEPSRAEGSGPFDYQPGQFAMLSVPHCGEAPISFASSPSEPAIRLSVRRAGVLTNALHEMEVGDEVGLRGPYGRPFPLDELAGKNLLFVAGGIGLAPLRSVIESCLADPDKFGAITLLYGCRTPADLAFKEELARWPKHPQMRCLVTVDQAAPGWDGPVGLVPDLLPPAGTEEGDKYAVPGTLLASVASDDVALLCGPPPMIRAVLSRLSALGLADEQIYTTLERHMKCGVGLCRHCHLDHHLVCVDGPVYSLAQLRKLNVMELAS